MTEVYLNSKFLGTVEDARSFVERIREERRMGSITSNLNVYHNETADEIYVESSKGRARRPLIVIMDGQPLLTEKHIKQLEKNEISWSDLVKQGVIEYLDAAEEENALAAFFEKDITSEHTHLEITPLAMFGLTTSLVPYSNYNQSTRVNAGSKNQKQALGLYASNYSVRMDMDVNILHY
ncbi:MAG: DNA-directed RNA polymerase subunit B, partial [Nanoarchaeota archaeon]